MTMSRKQKSKRSKKRSAGKPAPGEDRGSYLPVPQLVPERRALTSSDRVSAPVQVCKHTFNWLKIFSRIGAEKSFYNDDAIVIRLTRGKECNNGRQ